MAAPSLPHPVVQEGFVEFEYQTHLVPYISNG